MPREEKFNKLLSFPHDGFLMIRYEFMILTGGIELEAKLLRVIEKEMDDARSSIYKKAMNANPKERASSEIVEITKDVWAPISYRLFMAELYGTVASENTIKRALKSLIDKKLIARRYNPTGRYEAPEYQLNVPIVQEELHMLGKLGKSGYQPLIPSTNDTINRRSPQPLIPSKPSRVSIDDSLGYQPLVPNYNNNYIDTLKESTSPVPPIEPDSPSIPSFSPSSSSQEKDPEADRIQSYWCELGFTERPSAKKHWLTLSWHIASFEQMDSLFKFTQAAIKDKPNKRVFPGNLVDHLDGWKQEEERKKRLSEPVKITRSSTDPLAKMKAIGSQFINQGVN